MALAVSATKSATRWAKIMQTRNVFLCWLHRVFIKRREGYWWKAEGGRKNGNFPEAMASRAIRRSVSNWESCSAALLCLPHVTPQHNNTQHTASLHQAGMMSLTPMLTQIEIEIQNQLDVDLENRCVVFRVQKETQQINSKFSLWSKIEIHLHVEMEARVLCFRCDMKWKIQQINLKFYIYIDGAHTHTQNVISKLISKSASKQCLNWHIYFHFLSSKQLSSLILCPKSAIYSNLKMEFSHRTRLSSKSSFWMNSGRLRNNAADLKNPNRKRQRRQTHQAGRRLQTIMNHTCNQQISTHVIALCMMSPLKRWRLCCDMLWLLPGGELWENLRMCKKYAKEICGSTKKRSLMKLECVLYNYIDHWWNDVKQRKQRQAMLLVAFGKSGLVHCVGHRQALAMLCLCIFFWDRRFSIWFA